MNLLLMNLEKLLELLFVLFLMLLHRLQILFMARIPVNHPSAVMVLVAVG
jgi:hypothetical protein